jgi:hypothetical protein
MSAPKYGNPPEFGGLAYEMRCDPCDLHVGWESSIDDHHPDERGMVEFDRIQALWELAQQHVRTEPMIVHTVVITKSSTIMVELGKGGDA